MALLLSFFRLKLDRLDTAVDKIHNDHDTLFVWCMANLYSQDLQHRRHV